MFVEVEFESQIKIFRSTGFDGGRLVTRLALMDLGVGKPSLRPNQRKLKVRV
jgi:hypothetical protein